MVASNEEIFTHSSSGTLKLWSQKQKAYCFVRWDGNNYNPHHSLGLCVLPPNDGKIVSTHPDWPLIQFDSVLTRMSLTESTIISVMLPKVTQNLGLCN